MTLDELAERLEQLPDEDLEQAIDMLQRMIEGKITERS